MKAGISEIFAVYSGLMSACITLTRGKEKSPVHPIVELGYEALNTVGPIKARLARQDKVSAEQMSDSAVSLLGFLRKASVIIEKYPDHVLSDPKGKTGKTLSAVSEHIEDILAREELGGERFNDRYIPGGHIVAAFNADYLPGYVPPKKGKGDKKPSKVAQPAKPLGDVVPWAPSARP